VRKKVIPKSERKITSYLRVSTVDQDVEKNKASVLNFANSHNFIGKVQFTEEKISGMVPWRKRKLNDLVESLRADDVLIVPELSRVGRSLVEVLEVLSVLKDRGVAVYSVKENFQLNGSDIQSKVMRTMLALFSEIERDLISSRTKEGLAAARARGRLLGRPRGPGRSKLDPYRPEIEALLANGSPKTFIANRYNTSPLNLSLWMKKNKIQRA